MSASQGSLVNWDIFHADSLELERGLSTAAVRTGPGQRVDVRGRPCPARGHDGGLGAPCRYPRAI